MALDTLPAGMVQETAPVVLHRRIARDHYCMRLESPGVCRRARAGQFIHVLCAAKSGRGQTSGGLTPLLRRPFSLFGLDPEAGTIDFIYKVVGSGTAALAEIPVGSQVDFLGPLGRPFDIPAEIQEAYLVGGGVGIPPLHLLAKELLGRRGIKVHAFLGARTRDWVICASDFRRLGIPVHVATDDGTLGRRGSVVDLTKIHLEKSSSRKRGSDSCFRGNDIILAICGPTTMMAAAAELARRRGLSAQVSLEERMGCAMGCCMGCVVEVAAEPVHSHARFQRVCTEGPVFPAEAVLWK